MTSDAENPSPGEAGTPVRSGVSTAVIASVGTIVWGLVWSVFDLPLAVACLGVATMVAAAALGPRSSVAPRAGRLRDRRGATGPWPDTGMKNLLEALEDPAVLTDAQGIVRYRNSAALRHFGAIRAGDPLSFRLRIPEVLEALAAAGSGGEPAQVRFVLRGATERHYAARCKGLHLRRPQAAPAPDFILVELRDETEAVRVDRMRGDFIANASHELRTPLASLTGFIETLLGPARKDEQNRERFLRIMLEQAQRMGRLIDDLLSLSRAEMRAHVRPNGRVDLVALIHKVADTLAPIADERHASIAVALDAETAPIVGDADELTQVLANLVENAIKYGNDGGAVAIRLQRSGDGESPEGWRVVVADDGPGIAAEHLPRLTERFYRVDVAHSRQQKGTGLGLAIVKHILNRHHAKLKIQSAVGKGTEVQIVFEGGPVAV